MDIGQVLNLLGELGVILLIGTYVGKRGLLPSNANKLLTDLVINLVLPCNIIVSFLSGINRDTIREFISIFIISIIVQIISFSLAKLLYFKQKNGPKQALQYATIVSNAGFMGTPIAQGLFGLQGLLYTSIYLVPMRIMMWSVGLSLFTKKKNERWSLLKTTITHPCIFSVLIGLVIMFGEISLPIFLEESLRTIGSSLTFLSMFLIGTIFSRVPFRSLGNPSVLKYSFVRLLLLPFIVFSICKLLNTSQLVLNISVLLSGMPAASTTAILAEKYEGDSEFATTCVVISSLLSGITIPLLTLLLMQV